MWVQILKNYFSFKTLHLDFINIQLKRVSFEEVMQNVKTSRTKN